MAYSGQQGLQKESANLGLFGPATGAADFPTFRAAGSLDIPVGGVTAQSGDYNAAASDSGKIVSFNSASAVTYTLASPPPNSHWCVWVENIGAGPLTIARNGLTIDGATTNVTLFQNQGMFVSTDGTNYFTSRGAGSTAGVNAQSGTTYTAVASDSGKLLTFSNAGAVTLTLPATPPSASWWIFIQSNGAGGVTVARNGKTIDGASTNLGLTQNQGVVIFTDGSNYFTERGIGGSSSGAAGGVNSKTINYTADGTDAGKLISMNGTSITLTLPAAPPSSTWWIAIENLNSSSLTVGRNGLNIDGAAANLPIAQNQGVLIYTDGANYFTSRGIGSGGSGVTLETNGTPNGSQTLLNLVNGSGIAITDDGLGDVTIANTAGTDKVEVNGASVSDPCSITVLVNGAGPVGEVKANGFLSRNNFACMSEVRQQLAASTAYRNVSVTYQNPYSTPRLVTIAIRNNTNANCTFTAVSDSNPVPSAVVYKVTTGNKTSGTQLLVFFVMPGNYYQVTGTTGTINIIGWSEYQLTVGTFTDSGDIHASRALTTVFQNTTANLMLVSVQIGSVNASSAVQALSDTITPPPSTTSVVDDATNQSSSANTVTSFFLVPPGHYYKVTAASGSLAIWHEYSWGVPVVKSPDLLSTGGLGPTRTCNGSGQNVNTGSSTTGGGVIPCWLNNSGRVRVIATISHNSTASSDSFMSSGPSVYPLQYRSSLGPSSSNPRHHFIICLPWEFYAFFDTTTGTLSGDHWWEYDIG